MKVDFDLVDKKEAGERLFSFIKKNKLNRSRVARDVGLNPQTVWTYCKGKRIPFWFGLLMSKIYGLSIDWLYYGKGSMIELDGSEAELKGLRGLCDFLKNENEGQRRKIERLEIELEKLKRVG